MSSAEFPSEDTFHAIRKIARDDEAILLDLNMNSRWIFSPWIWNSFYVTSKEASQFVFIF